MRARTPPTPAIDPRWGASVSRGAGRWGAVLGAAGAALASAALVYWIGGSEDRGLTPATVTPPSPEPRAYAPARPDAGQVLRAYDQLQESYADEGLAGVQAFSAACGREVARDPATLDFCLAFDHFAAALDGASVDAARDLALARSALAPGADAPGRLAAVQALARRTSLASASSEETPAPAAARPKRPRAPTNVRKAAAAQSAKAAQRARLARVAAACRKRGPPARQVVCASPRLRQADLRMRGAYQLALAAGADPHRLARDQARWRARVNAASKDRAALARLYQRRTTTLQAQARRLTRGG